MLVLGIETSCDETGVAVYDTDRGLLAHALHSQVALHAAYGGVVPELASRDHVRHLVPLIEGVLAEAGHALADVGGIAYTEGPGLAGALLVGASVANALAFALEVPAVGVHHLEGHLLSPLLATPRPTFPFVALLVSGGHSQLFEVAGVGRYRLLGDTLDDAAGEAFDKTAKLLGLPYPGGPALAALADRGRDGVFALPRPMLGSGTLDMSFSGLKTAVLTLVRRLGDGLDDQARADIAREFQAAVVDVLVSKALGALEATALRTLVVAGGVGANRHLRERLRREAERRGVAVHFPDLAFCTDNGAMIALAGALRMAHARAGDGAFGVRPRWGLTEIAPPAGAP
ncbi:MAG TPA: tRNA (adenosine(37)-N6)-threonylcarbamoyltransferase complex transferase subunit TsaD [Casimicrobiaceae bacterium]|nr:tRNA (adenosine(37)-N6)-threonylcarbamoyltransferase complex transferase subunit TsaD [Casimicrobiaceae bacterium]